MQDDIFAKTEKGREEIQTRRYKLSPPLRTLLIMMDGRTKAGEILKQVAQLGITPNAIDRLQKDGFIAIEKSAPSVRTEASQQGVEAKIESEQERFFLAQRFMNESAVNASGLRSFMFTLKLEKSGSLNDLRDLLSDYVNLIEKSSGEIEAAVLINKVKELLA